MNTSDTIEYILKNASPNIQIGVPPDGKVPFFAGVSVGIPMGAPGNQVVANIQAVGDTVQECLQSLAKQVEQLNAIRQDPPKLAVVESNGRIR